MIEKRVTIHYKLLKHGQIVTFDFFQLSGLQEQTFTTARKESTIL